MNLKDLKPIVLIIVVLLLTVLTSYPQRKFGGRVVEVIDGQTCVVLLPNGRLTAVLQYIETPAPEQPLHSTVRDHLRALLLDKQVEFMPRSVIQGGFVGRLTVGGIDVSQQMLRDGAAWHARPETSGQDAAESALYRDNEAQAKAEKRGVWGVPGLKPVWEFRAEQVASEKRAAEERAEKMRLEAMWNRRGGPPKKAAPKPQRPVTEMWADVGGAYGFEQPLGFGGLLGGYDPASRIGHISTASIFLDFPQADFLSRVESRVYYLYKGDKANIEDSVYALAFVATAAEFKFAARNDLTLTADAEKIPLGKAARFHRRLSAGAQELLVYRVKRAQLMKLVAAEKITIRLGNYTGGIARESVEYINTLLLAS